MSDKEIVDIRKFCIEIALSAGLPKPGTIIPTISRAELLENYIRRDRDDSKSQS